VSAISSSTTAEPNRPALAALVLALAALLAASAAR